MSTSAIIADTATVPPKHNITLTCMSEILIVSLIVLRI